jgi:hypothetical protein
MSINSHSTSPNINAILLDKLSRALRTKQPLSTLQNPMIGLKGTVNVRLVPNLEEYNIVWTFGDPTILLRFFSFGR